MKSGWYPSPSCPLLCSSASVNLCDTVPDKWLYGSRGKKVGFGLKRTEPFIQPLYEQRCLDHSLPVQTLSWISRKINPRFKSPFIQKAPRVRKGARDCVTARSAACCGPASQPGPPDPPWQPRLPPSRLRFNTALYAGGRGFSWWLR